MVDKEEDKKAVLFSVDINPETVNKIVAEAIMKSVLGEQVKKSVETAAKNWLYDYKYTNEIDRCIEDGVKVFIKELIYKEFMPKIKEQVVLKLGKTFEGEIVDKLVVKFIEELIKRIQTLSVDRW